MKMGFVGFKNLPFTLLYSCAIILTLTLGGRYLYTNLLPKYFSSQDPLDLNTLVEDSDSKERFAVFDNKETRLPTLPAENLASRQVLAAHDDNNQKEESNKRIEIDLTNQKLYAYEGDKLIYEFLVSTGKWGQTPTGEFRIWTKLKSAKMSGGSKALHTYYYLPKVPHTMYFSNSEVPASRGFGLHGAYWHNNFGHPMSHGCVNIGLENAEKLYYWAEPELGDKTSIRATKDNPGTKIIIYGKAPNN